MANEEMRVAFRILGKTDRVPICLCDPEGEFQAWMDRYLSLDGSCLFSWNTVDLVAGNHRPRTRRPSILQRIPLAPGDYEEQGQYTSNLREKSGYWDERRPITPQVGLPTINWPAPPRLKINSLWWPTGATRWAVGMFLVTEENLRKIVNRSQLAIGLEHSMIATDGRTETSNTISLYPLTPRRVTATQSKSDLWLLPVVDIRYFWQWTPWTHTEHGMGGFAPYAEIVTTPEHIWMHLIGTALGDLYAGGWIAKTDADLPKSYLTDHRHTIDAIPESYRYPDYLEFKRQGVSAAYVLDAAAASIGKRVVVSPHSLHSGTPGESSPAIWIMGPSRSKAILADNIAKSRPKLVAGGCAAFDLDSTSTAATGEFHYDAAEKPRCVSVIFVTHHDTKIDVLAEITHQYNRLYPETGSPYVPLASDRSLSIQVWEDGQVEIQDNYSELGSSVPPAGPIPGNSFFGQKVFLDSASWFEGTETTYFEALAVQIAADYMASLGYSFDVCYAGLIAWNPSGFDDFLEYNFGVQDGTGEYLCTTRAASLPANCGVSHMLHLVDITGTGDDEETNAFAESQASESESAGGESQASSYSGTQTVTVVTGVYCDDGDIVVQTTDLYFDSAGRFLHSGNVDPPPV